MPRIRRRFLLEPTEVGVYHCINRCVRRSFLCGTDQVSGKCYDHRKQWIQDLDESALAACLAYVDLNPIRACVAATPETSQYTSVYERIHALDRRVGDDPAAIEAESVGSQRDAEIQTASLKPETGSRPARAAWLSPFELSEAVAAEPVPSSRASNKGCLDMSFAEYLQLLDWTGRQLRQDKRGAIPADLAPILERLQVSDEGWLQLIGQFSRMFRRAAGRPQSLQREREERGCQVMQGIRHSRAVFL